MRRDALLVVSGLSLSYGEGSCNSTPYFYLLSIVLLSERDYGEERACSKGVMVETEIKIVEILFVLVPFLTHTLKKFFFFFLLATFFCLCHCCWTFWTSIFAFHHYWEGPTQQLHSDLIADVPLRLEETLLSGPACHRNSKAPSSRRAYDQLGRREQHMR